LEELRRQPALISTPTVAVTASAMPGEEERIVAAGFTGYLAKPYVVEDIIGLVMRLLTSE
jgi:CheY-like chemotaxis protein